MGPLARTVVGIGALSLALTAGCSADTGDGVDSNSANHTEVPVLSLENVFLEHADPAYWEPGDPEYAFPVAARIFYGYRPFEDVKMELSDTCRGHVGVQAAGEGRDATYTLWCAPDGDDSRSFPFTTASESFGQEEDAFDIVRGTSFEFVDSVALERIEAHHYLLDVQPPPAG